MGKRAESGENIEKHGKTGRIRGKHRKTRQNRENQGKHRKTRKNRENQGKHRKTWENVENLVKT